MNGGFLGVIHPPSESLEGRWDIDDVFEARRDGYWPSIGAKRIFVCGGYSAAASDYTTNARIYDVDTDTWEIITDMPVAKESHHVGRIGSMVYAVGGRNSSGAHLRTCYKYDIDLNTWTAIADLVNTGLGLGGLGFSGHGGVEYDGKLYVSGSEGHTQEYDPDTNVWTAKATESNVSTGTIGDGANGKLYRVSAEADELQTHEYDPSTNTWTYTLADSPRVHSQYGSFASDGDNLYVAGGYGPLASSTGSHGKFSIYDIADDSWSTGADHPLALRNHVSAFAGGYFWTIGGYVDGVGYKNDVVRYDPILDAWTTGYSTYWSTVGTAAGVAIP